MMPESSVPRVAPPGSREHLIEVARAVAANPCNCTERCCDAQDEEGVCIGLPSLPPEPYLPEIVLVHRDEVSS